MESLLDMIKRHEGFCSRAYKCPAGRWTIGFGRNIEDVGISRAEAEELLKNDIARVEKEAAETFPWFVELNKRRRFAVLNMIYQLGLGKFMQFKATIAHIEKGEYSKAADEALNSLWAKQTPIRAKEVSDMLR